MPLIQQSGSVAIGTPIGSGTSGSVVFIDSSGNLAQDNTNLRFDDAANSLTLGGNLLFTTNDVSTIGVTGTRPNKVWVGTGGIDSSGNINLPTSGSTIGHSTSVLWRFLNTANISLMNSSTERMRFGGSGIEINSAHYLGWNSTGSPTGSPDLILLRGGAGTLEQRNATTSQAFNVYKTYTDASNYERGVFSWSVTANVLTIGAMALGTGIRRNVTFEAENYTFRSGGNDRFFINGGTAICAANFEPNVSATRDCGANLLRWRVGYFNQLNVGYVSNTTALTLAGTNLDAANAQSLVLLLQTWNTTGSPTGFLANFTNTASGASTNLFDWQLAGVSQFKLHKSTGLSLFQGGQTLTITSASVISDNGSFSMGTGSALIKWASNRIYIERTTNAQTFQLYRTYTDASNYAYLEQTWSGNNALIRTVGLGTGTVGDIILSAGNGFSNLTLSGSSNLATFNVGVLAQNSGYIGWTGRGRFKSSANGLVNVLNAAETSFTRFTLGPESVNFPSLKVNSGVGVEIKTGNDATFMDIKTMSHTFDGSTPGALVDGMIWFDGTDLKIRVSGVTYTLTKT